MTGAKTEASSGTPGATAPGGRRRRALDLGIDRADRNMLFLTLGAIALLLILLAFFTPAQDKDRNPTPDSYLTGQHGARAAYTLLERSGYAIERWEQPLSLLAAQAGPGTVVVLAEPLSASSGSREAVAAILAKGATVVATGLAGGFLLPGQAVSLPRDLASFAACEAQPDGLSPLAGSGSIWIVPAAVWEDKNAEVRSDFTCAGEPVVVDYAVGSGHAIWWASSTPLENGSIERGQNLELLLHSIGQPEGRHVYWDESLHGMTRTYWDYTSGPLWTLLWSGALGMALLWVLSFSRRSGPVRPLPRAPRTTPIEFLDALGGLYRATGAAETAMQIAWERFRSQAVRLTGASQAIPIAELGAIELARAIERRFPMGGATGAGMEADLVAAEKASLDSKLKPRRALTLIRALRRHEESLRQATARGR